MQNKVAIGKKSPSIDLKALHQQQGYDGNESNRKYAFKVVQTPSTDVRIQQVVEVEKKNRTFNPQNYTIKLCCK